MKLKFSKGNAKLSKDTAILSLPAGFTCPGALECLSRANKVTGKVTDGPATKFRCYAASNEALFKNIRKGRWNNFELLKGKSKSAMVDLIQSSLPRRRVKLVRLHASGDFFNQDYFDAWCEVARLNPDLTFYAYTKALLFWVKSYHKVPPNLKLVYSIGGRFDDLVKQYPYIRTARVVFSEQQAKEMKLPIDHDDTHAWDYDGSFAILLHGTQPSGSEAGKAWYKLRQQGKGGYRAGYFDHYEIKDKAKREAQLQG